MEENKKKQNKLPAQPAQQEQTSSVIPFEEQMARRQSAPRPTAQSELQRMQMASPMQADPNGAVDGFAALAEVIGREEIQKAQQILNKYKGLRIVFHRFGIRQDLI